MEGKIKDLTKINTELKAMKYLAENVAGYSLVEYPNKRCILWVQTANNNLKVAHWVDVLNLKSGTKTPSWLNES